MHPNLKINKIKAQTVKILIFTPIWKRPEITKLYLEGLAQLTEPCPLDISTVVILSPSDPTYQEHFDLLQEHNIDFIEAPNRPLGRKKNIALNYLLKNERFDYLLELNSDGILHPDIWDLYNPHITDEVPLIGLRNLYFWDKVEDKVYFQYDYATDGHTFGSGRLYHRSILCENFWDDNWQFGLDIAVVKRNNIKDFGIDTGFQPLMLDIKTATNLNPMPLILARREGRPVEVDRLVLKIFMPDNKEI